MENDRAKSDDAMHDGEEEEENVQQIRVTFHLAAEYTKSAAHLQVPTDVIAVPATVGRKELSAVIHHLLGHDDDDDSDNEEDESSTNKDSKLSFEFLLSHHNHRLLRTTIEREARRTGASLEEALRITYFPAQPPPEPQPSAPRLPDWIGSLDCTGQGILCAGCYDGSLVLLDTFGAQQQLSALTSRIVHRGPIRAVSAVQMESTLYMATGSMDQTLQWHSYSIKDQSWNTQPCTGGHTAALTSVDVFAASNTNILRLASGDWDGVVCIWDCLSNERDDVTGTDTPAAAKRSKTSTDQALDAIAPPLMVTSFQAHSSQVSGVAWGNFEKAHHAMPAPSTITTSSWDHSIKVWDVERQDCLLTLNGQRVVTCIDTSYFTAGIVASGHPDCAVRLWDVRTADTKAASSLVTADTTFRPSHAEWVSAVRWSPHNPYQLASTSYDGTVRLWDLRSERPLHTIRAFEKKTKEKGLTLCFSKKDETLYAGGSDCEIKQFRLGGRGALSSSSSAAMDVVPNAGASAQ